MTQAIFTLDLERCTGCAACAIACSNENEVGDGLSWRQTVTFNEERAPGIGVFHYSLACNHCSEPACLHGCPARAYRKDAATGAVLLDADRGMVGFSIFWFAASATFVAPVAAPFAGPVALVAGFATLIAMDLVYRVPGQRVAAVPHGAMTTLTALFLLGLLLREPWVAAGAGALKLALWPWTGGVPRALTAARVAAGFAWPLMEWIARPDAPLVLLLAGPAIGETLERLRFYAELEFLTPRIQIQRDLPRAPSR